MKNQRKFLVFLILFAAILYSWTCIAASVNSCVTCHTNEAMMKAMHKPIPLPAGEGEG